MKFLVFSDSHEYTSGMDYAIEKHKHINHIIHCGDMASDVLYLHHVYGSTHSICGVCGNNDYSAPDPFHRVVFCGRQKIYVTHGHREHVKSSLYTLKSKAMSSGCGICIFGHTHKQFFEEQDGLVILNPGSIGYFKQEYAVITVEAIQINVELMKL